MKAGIFDPYLDTLGGGERYMLTIAECLAKKGFNVDIFWNGDDLKKKAEERFSLDLSGISFRKNIFGSEKTFFSKYASQQEYDLIFFLSDGSIPFLFGKKNILHFQVPFSGRKGKSFLNALKWPLIDSVICNSEFTKRHIEVEYGIKAKVIYPPADLSCLHAGQKKNIILSVGRFTRLMNAKKQDVLIDSFLKLIKGGLRGWRFVMAGGLSKEDSDYMRLLKSKCNNAPIEFFPNVKTTDLLRLYSQSKIFWHSAGYGEDENLFPGRVEHFGIVIVEAMASGCVPVAMDKGGIPEIIKDNENGFLWKETDDLIKKTELLIKDNRRRESMAKKASERSRNFSKDVFYEKISEIIK